VWRQRLEAARLPETLTTLAGHALLRGDELASRELTLAADRLQSKPSSARRQLLSEIAERDGGELPAAAAGIVRRLATDGREAVLRDAERRLPPDLRRLLSVPGISLADVLAVHRRTGAVTAGDLAAAVGTLGHPVSDVDEDLRRRIEAALPSLRAGHPRLGLGRALLILDRAAAGLRDALPDVAELAFSGSVRRFEPTVGDLELTLASAAGAAALDAAVTALRPEAVLHHGTHRLALVIEGTPVTVRVVPPAEFPFALLYYTGSAGHVRQLQRRAFDRGWRLSAAGLEGAATTCHTEADVYAALGLSYIPPELRHGEDEIAAAGAGAPQDLVTVDDIRGDLHVHTLWSDGRDSVEHVAYAARALGYEYVAVTDHSQRAAASRVLSVEKLERQRLEVEAARRKVTGITILHGAEVDILPDGSLDFPDGVLQRLDVVLASLHEPAGQSPDRLLSRYERAMRHPLVHVITHPANRLVGHDDGYRLDYQALFRLAVETGTVLEIDGGPGHLDLDGRLARQAITAGVTLSIDSDCHNAARLRQQMAMGVGTARRGAVQPRHVLNTRRLEEVLGHFEAKRARATAAGRSHPNP
jgi:DNA polymerase (family 10)